MGSTSLSPHDASADQGDHLAQLSPLSVLLGSINETCKAMSNTQYSSGEPEADAALSKFQVFENKLAQILDTRKGGDTVTALVCLDRGQGPEFVFCSNSRSETQLEMAKTFLSDILVFAAKKPDGMTSKTFHRQILCRILEFNFQRVVFYLKSLEKHLDECILDCRGEEQDEPSELELSKLRDRAVFPRDISSSDPARQKFLRDCDTLLKAIYVAKIGSLNKIIDWYAKEPNSKSWGSWCHLRHYLSRLLSYRQATDILIAASAEWPDVFKNVTVKYFKSGVKLNLPLPRDLSVESLAQVAFRGYQYLTPGDEFDISDLQAHGLEKNIMAQLPEKDWKAGIHAEVNLHDHLFRQNKTLTSQFWGQSAYIATSKPPCRLCYFYFDNIDDDVQVRSSHMNLYPRWRLPEGHDEQSVAYYKEVLAKIIAKLQNDTERILTNNIPQGKRMDSRTDTHTGSWVDVHGREGAFSGSISRGTSSRMDGVSLGPQQDGLMGHSHSVISV